MMRLLIFYLKVFRIYKRRNKISEANVFSIKLFFWLWKFFRCFRVAVFFVLVFLRGGVAELSFRQRFLLRGVSWWRRRVVRGSGFDFFVVSVSGMAVFYFFFVVVARFFCCRGFFFLGFVTGWGARGLRGRDRVGGRSRRGD